MSDAHDSGVDEITNGLERSSFEENGHDRPKLGKGTCHTRATQVLYTDVSAEYKQAQNENVFDSDDSDNDGSDDSGDDDEHHASPPNQADESFAKDEEEPGPDEDPHTGDDESTHGENPDTEHQQEHRSDSEGPKSSKSSSSTPDESDGTSDHRAQFIDLNIWKTLAVGKTGRVHKRWVHKEYLLVGEDTKQKRKLFIRAIRSLSRGHDPSDCIPVNITNLPGEAKNYSTVLLYTIMMGLVFTQHASGDKFWSAFSASKSANLLALPGDDEDNVSDEAEQDVESSDEDNSDDDQSQEEEDHTDTGPDTEGFPEFNYALDEEDRDYTSGSSSSGEEGNQDERQHSTDGEDDDLGSQHISGDDSKSENGDDDDNSSSSDDGDEEGLHTHAENASVRSPPRQSRETTWLRPGGPPTRASASNPTTVSLSDLGRKRSLNETGSFQQGRRGSGKRLRMSVDHNSAEEEDDAFVGLERNTGEQNPQSNQEPSEQTRKSAMKKDSQPEKKPHKDQRRK